MSLTQTLIYWGISIAFIVSSYFKPYPGSFLLKSAPIFFLSFLFFKFSGNYYWVMGLGFLFGGFGDIFLDLHRDKYFIQGLVSFLLGHICFISFFLLNFNKENIQNIFIILSVILIIAMVYLLSPKLGKLLVPVYLYMVVITLMSACSAMTNFSSLLLPIGAFIFMLSDSLIAIQKFYLVNPSPQIYNIYTFAIMLTYYGAQFLFSKALL